LEEDVEQLMSLHGVQCSRPEPHSLVLVFTVDQKPRLVRVNFPNDYPNNSPVFTDAHGQSFGFPQPGVSLVNKRRDRWWIKLEQFLTQRQLAIFEVPHISKGKEILAETQSRIEALEREREEMMRSFENIKRNMESSILEKETQVRQAEKELAQLREKPQATLMSLSEVDRKMAGEECCYCPQRKFVIVIAILILIILVLGSVVVLQFLRPDL